MVSNGDKWIRIFDIPDISKHRKGFNIYKVISMLYPESCPDAITKITVWKRFNDFKKLQREIKVLHKKHQLKDKFPSLPGASFFKRFDDDIVQERRQSILNFLEYVGCHSQLFTSNEFVKFFETSHTPVDQLNSNINAIRADLNLPEDPEYYLNSDDEPTFSDTDSVTTLNSLQDCLSKSKLSLNTSIGPSHHSRNNSDSISISTTTDSMTLLDGHIYPTPPNTPGGGDYVQYIIDASIHVNMAMELENDKKFDEAFLAYRTAIDILLKNGQDDKNYDRRQMVRYKTEKYLIRAEKIYNMHLATEVKNLKEIREETEEKEEHLVQRPMSDLYKYKVVRTIASGMLVLHAEMQQLFYIKVIHKTMKFLNDNLILPENVPYMVKLYNYYNCENALFLVLEYCSGTKLWDYLKQCSETMHDDVFYHSAEDQFLKQVQEMELSDGESEHSYSDLINEYTSNKAGRNGSSSKSDKLENEASSSSDGSYEKINVEDLQPNHVHNLMDDQLPENLESVDDLFSKSQLVFTQESTTPSPQKLREEDDLEVAGSSSQRKFSQMSSVEEVEVPLQQTYFIPVKDVVKWSAQLLLALEKLHCLGVICCDLRSENLLITEDGNLMLTYMCNVSEICDAMCNEKSFYMAPEIYSFQPITNAVDWWCFGAILYELLVGMPLSTIHPDGLSSYTHLKIPKYVSAEGRSMLKQLLTFEPHDRLGAGPNGTENLKSHPFFHSVSWDNLLAKCSY